MCRGVPWQHSERAEGWRPTGVLGLIASGRDSDRARGWNGMGLFVRTDRTRAVGVIKGDPPTQLGKQ